MREDKISIPAGCRKFFILREKAISRMDSSGPGLPSRFNQSVLIQITEGRFRRTDKDSTIRKRNVFGISVSLRINGDSFQIQRLTGSYNPDSYFASVGDKNGVKRHVDIPDLENLKAIEAPCYIRKTGENLSFSGVERVSDRHIPRISRV